MHECMRSDACIAEREPEPEIACISACAVTHACVHQESLTNTCNKEVYEHATAATERRAPGMLDEHLFRVDAAYAARHCCSSVAPYVAMPCFTHREAYG